jgi:hypothetical protein
MAKFAKTILKTICTIFIFYFCHHNVKICLKKILPIIYSRVVDRDYNKMPNCFGTPKMDSQNEPPKLGYNVSWIFGAS